MRAQEFQQLYDFPLDPFQIRAIEALDGGASVLVAAPTGSGKTVIADYAAWSVLNSHAFTDSHNKVFYTSPIKALTNQKFGDFTQKYGADQVGLMTGDHTVNPGNRLLSMTTDTLCDINL
jgi:ATP-dependent RNA helicase HelY